MGSPGPGPGVAASSTRTTFKAQILFGRSTAPGLCLWWDLHIYQLSTLWRLLQGQWVRMAGNRKGQCSAGTWQAKPCICLHMFKQLSEFDVWSFFSNKKAFIFVGPLQSQHCIIFITHGRQKAHHTQVKGWLVWQVISRTNGRMFVTVWEVNQLDYTIVIILFMCFTHILLGCRGPVIGDLWTNVQLGASTKYLQQGLCEQPVKRHDGHLKSLTIFYRVNMELLLLFIFIILSEDFYLFSIYVNMWTLKTLLMKVLSLSPYLKLLF